MSVVEATVDFHAALRHREAHDCALISMPQMNFWNNKQKTEEEKAHIKDRAQTLQAGIRMSYEDKCRHTEKVIKRALETPGVKWALSYSGGKDSTVLSHYMVYGMGLRVPHVMSNTRMEYPETVRQVNRWFKRLRADGVECQVVFPDDRPSTLWKEIGVPLWSKEIAGKYRRFRNGNAKRPNGHIPDDVRVDFGIAKFFGLKITDQCCHRLKKKPMKRWAKERGIGGKITGTRCSESRSRRLAWIQCGSLYQAVSHGGEWLANPLAFWTLDDVLRYLRDNGIMPLVPDTPDGGSGCMTCLFGCRSRAKDGKPNNLQDLKMRNPKMWKAALDDWGYREVLELLGIPYE